MVTEHLILIASWAITSVCLYIFIPRNQYRPAFVIFLFKQFITWPIGLLVVELGLIRYPIRLFQTATSTSFTFEFFVYPALCVFFNLYYPENKHWIRKVLHYVIYSSAITIFEYSLERYTSLIDYIAWEWYWSWLTLFLTFLASRYFYKWFYKEQFVK